MKTKAFWLTGLSGAGKSTVCEHLFPKLKAQGLSYKLVDGDDVRNEFHQNLGFEFDDVMKNNLLVVDLIKKYIDTYDVILVPVIAPYDKVRNKVKEVLGDKLAFVYCDANLDSVKKRDVKGLYSKAEKGLIKNMLGFSEGYPYEIPTHPDLILKTEEGGPGAEACSQILFDFIQSRR
jgi:adenylyl-sulfate kinase